MKPAFVRSVDGWQAGADAVIQAHIICPDHNSPVVNVTTAAFVGATE